MKTLKKLLLGFVTVMAMAVLCAVCAGAETYGDYEYSVLDNGTVSITDYTGTATTLVIPSQIDGKPVTEIGYQAFYRCDTLVSVTIPDSVTRIANYAFEYCYDLVSMNIPDSVNALGYCSFYSCTSLESITLGSGVKTIGNSAFANCNSLAAINVSSNNTYFSSINGVLFDSSQETIRLYPTGKTASSYVIPDGVVTIGYEAFENCDSLKSITIPDSVKEIESSAFGYCTSLETIKIPGSVESIGSSAFSRCSSLSSVTIAEGVETIYDYAFAYCSSLASITIPASVTEIYYNIFQDCFALTSINVSSKNTCFASVNGVLFDYNKEVLICYPVGKTAASYTIPDGVKHIHSNAFYNCDNLVLVTIPDSVISIGTDAFEYCDNITSVTIPDSVTSIGSYAFAYCSNLETILVPDSIEVMKPNAFYRTKWYSEQSDGIVYIGKIAYDYKGTLPEGSSVSVKDGTLLIADQLFYDYDTEIVSISIPDSVKFIGASAFENCASLASVTFGNSVEVIGSYAFEDCTSLTSVTLPDSVERLSENAFADCNSLAEIKFGNGLKYINPNAIYNTAWYINQPDGIIYTGKVACEYKGTMPSGASIIIKDGTLVIADEIFYGCSGLVSVTIPESVTMIGDRAFYNCQKLTTIKIPSKVTYIGKGAFYDCYALTSVNIPDGITSIEQDTFYYCYSLTSITIPDSVTTIGDYAFYNCNSLSSVTISDNVTSIGIYAFAYCYDIPTLTIPEKVESIGSWAFTKCNSFESVKIPDGVKTIGRGAFNGCSHITIATIPQSVTSIGVSAFADCDLLTAVNVAYGNTDYKSVNGVLFDYAQKTVLCYPAGKTSVSYTIPTNVTSIGDFAFYGCSYLNTVSIPDSVTKIGEYAFYECVNLKSMTIPDGVKIIEDYTFYDCYSLSSITIPDSVISIGGRAFYYCVSLSSITIPDSVITIGERAFYYCKTIPSISIPSSVIKIDSGAFNSCSGLKSVTIGNGVKTIGNSAFHGCSSLVSITIPEKVGYIGEAVFDKCTSLTAINVSDKNNFFSDVNGILFDKNKSTLIRYPEGKTAKSYTVPDGVVYLGDDAFSYCSSLTSVRLPAGLIRIGDFSFYKCESLTGITIPDGVTTIGSNSFEFASSLKLIIIPASVNSIGTSAFSYRSSELIIYGKSGSNAETYAASKGITFNVVADSPAKVAGVKVSARISDAIRLSWTKNATADGYIIEKYDGSKWVRVAKVTDNATTTYKVTELEPSTTYKFRIYAYTMINSSYALYGDYTNVTGTTNPSTVADFSIGATVPDAIRLKWTKNTTADGYILEQYNGSEWVRIVKLASNATTSYRVSGLKLGVTYKFRISGYNMVGDIALYSGYTSLSGKTGVCDVEGLKVGATVSDAIRLNWTKNSIADGYIIEKYDGNEWVRVAKISDNTTTTYRVENLKACTTYKLRICAYKMSDGNAYYSGYSDVTGTTILNVVTELEVGARISDAIRLNWAKNANADGYIIEQYDGAKWVRVTKITSNATTTYKVTGLNPSTTYKFRICAYKMPEGKLFYSEYTNVTGTTTPSTVEDFKIGATATDAIRLNWTKNTTADGYILEQYNGSKWVRIAKLTSNATTTYRVENLVLGTTYKFRICGYNMVGDVALYGGYVSVTGKANISAVTGLEVGAAVTDAIRLNWNKNAGIDGYIIEMFNGSKWERVVKLSGNTTTTYRVEKLTAGTVYKFRICAYMMTGSSSAVYSDYTTIISATKPKAVVDFEIAGRAADALRFNWTKNTSADGYIIEMYNGGKWVRLAKITDNATTEYKITGLSASTLYKFRICAYKMDGATAYYSSYSETLEARTNPTKVAGFTVAGRAADALRFNWDKNTTADGYIIEMYKNGEWVRLAKIADNATTEYKITGLSASTLYKFRICSYKMDGTTPYYSYYSDTLSARTNPTKVAGFRIGGVAENALRLEWNKNTTADGYIIEMYKNGEWVRVVKIMSNTTLSYRVESLASGTNYKFRICSYKMDGTTPYYSYYSDTLSGTTN